MNCYALESFFLQTQKTNELSLESFLRVIARCFELFRFCNHVVARCFGEAGKIWAREIWLVWWESERVDKRERKILWVSEGPCLLWSEGAGLGSSRRHGRGSKSLGPAFLHPRGHTQSHPLLHVSRPSSAITIITVVRRLCFLTSHGADKAITCMRGGRDMRLNIPNFGRGWCVSLHLRVEVGMCAGYVVLFPLLPVYLISSIQWDFSWFK